MHQLKLDSEEVHTPTYAGRSFSHDIPKYRLPKQGMSADAAYQLVHDELNLDGNPALNLATFVTSWMEPEADTLATETLNKNLIDQDEYPQTDEIHQRVVQHARPPVSRPSGCRNRPALPPSAPPRPSCSACWRTSGAGSAAAKRKARRDRPNVVFGADVHTCWEKFARYFDVQSRVAPLEPTATPHGHPGRAADRRAHDRGGGPLGHDVHGPDRRHGPSTSCSHAWNPSSGWRIPLHIDAASGGFVVPFLQPGLEWDFRLSHVRSINVSNHKFGLVYPGMGTVVFRDRSDLPEELVFHINYLGGDMPNYSLNFSRPSSSVVLQYFNFLRLGHAGYAEIVANVLSNARALASKLGKIEGLELLNDGSDFPIVALRASDPERTNLTLLSERLREHGWIVPAYTLPPNAEHLTVLRMVVKENFSRDMVDMLAHDLRTALHTLHAGPSKRERGARTRPHC